VEIFGLAAVKALGMPWYRVRQTIGKEAPGVGLEPTT